MNEPNEMENYVICHYNLSFLEPHCVFALARPLDAVSQQPDLTLFGLRAALCTMHSTKEAKNDKNGNRQQPDVEKKEALMQRNVCHLLIQLMLQSLLIKWIIRVWWSWCGIFRLRFSMTILKYRCNKRRVLFHFEKKKMLFSFDVRNCIRIKTRRETRKIQEATPLKFEKKTTDRSLFFGNFVFLIRYFTFLLI